MALLATLRKLLADDRGNCAGPLRRLRRRLRRALGTRRARALLLLLTLLMVGQCAGAFPWDPPGGACVALPRETGEARVLVCRNLQFALVEADGGFAVGEWRPGPLGFLLEPRFLCAPPPEAHGGRLTDHDYLETSCWGQDRDPPATASAQLVADAQPFLLGPSAALSILGKWLLPGTRVESRLCDDMTPRHRAELEMHPRYFPAEGESPRARVDRYMAGWYSERLHMLGEPSIYAARREGAREVYRFSDIGAMGPARSVRVEVSPDGSGELVARQLQRPSDVSVESRVRLSPAKVAALVDAIEQAKFWRAGPDSRMGEDGWEWIFEGLRGGRYHVVARWCPDEGVWLELGDLFSRLAREEGT